MQEMKTDDTCCSCRELNLFEEIDALDIDFKTKERIIRKGKDMMEQIRNQNEYLQRCHNRIYWLEKACAELSLLVAKQKDGAD